jgi:hypothetical protein
MLLPVTSRRASTPFGPIASAFGLYLFLGAFNVLAAAVVPWLLELWERSPRLGAFGLLLLIASPAGFVAVAHHATHALMDRFDVTDAPKVVRGLMPGLESVRAGLFAWFVISFASMASAFLFLVIFPPPPGEDTLSTLIRIATDFRLQATVHALLWIGVAALLYDVDRRVTTVRSGPRQSD